jgi:hypothetical protein
MNTSFPQLSARAKDTLLRVKKFIDEKIIPNEELFEKQHHQQSNRWQVPPLMEGIIIIIIIIFVFVF